MKKRSIIASEYQEQCAFVDWLIIKQIPHYSVPNGVVCSVSERYKLIQSGLSAGVPDVVIPIPKPPFHGLYIEVKRRDKYFLSIQQKYWLKLLNQNMYHAIVCLGVDECIKETIFYLGI